MRQMCTSKSLSTQPKVKKIAPVLWLVVLAAFCSNVAGQPSGAAAHKRHGFANIIGHLPIQRNGQVRQDVADVWGYYDSATGREYALVGYGIFTNPPNAGVSIIDVTDPVHPFEVAHVDSVPGFDLKVWQHYLYSVNGLSTGEGRITDISDPANPRLVRSFPSAHNIFISDRGYLHLESPGLSIFDLNFDPTYPMLVWSSGMQGHDAAVIGDRLYDFHGTSGTNIYDVSDPVNPRLLGTIRDPSIAYHHSGWTSADGRYLFICDELARHPSADVSVFDISNPANPERVGEYIEPNATVHNLYVIGNYAHLSYYTAGYVVLDVSDPTHPQKVGEFDTAPSFEGEGYDGAFGVYVFSPSGNIFVSDFEGGLFIFSAVDQTTGIGTGLSESPSNFKIIGNYPNPFNAQTTINYHLPGVGMVEMWIFNTGGQKVRTLVQSVQPAGDHNVVWDAKDDLGQEVPSGVYFCQIQSLGFRDSKRLLLLK